MNTVIPLVSMRFHGPWRIRVIKTARGLLVLKGFIDQVQNVIFMYSSMMLLTIDMLVP